MSVRAPSFRFQFKGLYPALEEASRVSPGFRGRLEHLVDEVDCTVCGGSRLRDDAAAMRFRDRTIDEICRQPLGKMLADFLAWKPTASERKIAGEVYREICNRTQFLVDVGLDYLTLARPAPTLSGGEMQRIRLAAQVGSGLCGVLYVLDEPTIGLHPRDNTRLLGRPEETPRPGQYPAAGRARPRGDRRTPTNCSISAPAPVVMAGRSWPKARRTRSASGAARSPVPISPARRRLPCRQTAGWPAVGSRGERAGTRGGRKGEGRRVKGKRRFHQVTPSPLLPLSLSPLLPPGSKSAGPATTTSRTSTSKSRWAR